MSHTRVVRRRWTRDRIYQWGTSRNLEYKASLYALPEVLDGCRLAPLFVEKGKMPGCMTGDNTVIVSMAAAKTRQDYLVIAEEMLRWVVEQFHGAANVVVYRAHGPQWVWVFEDPQHAVHFKLRWG